MSKKPIPLPSQERLKELFDYSVITGLLYEKTRRNSRSSPIGEPVKDGLTCGYRCVRIDGSLYKQHRVIWKLVTGEDPLHQIDHINQVRIDNSWHNLRLATSRQQKLNQGLGSHSTSGFRGVTFHKQRGKFQSQIRFNGTSLFLGLFLTAEEASQTYEAMASILHGSFYCPPA